MFKLVTKKNKIITSLIDIHSLYFFRVTQRLENFPKSSTKCFDIWSVLGTIPVNHFIQKVCRFFFDKFLVETRAKATRQRVYPCNGRI